MHPVQLHVAESERRSRLTTFFRLILVIPHAIFLMLWGFAAGLATLLAWFAILFTGRYPGGLFRFVGGYARYAIRVQAYTHLLSDAWPPFSGEAPYVVNGTIEEPEHLSRLTTFFRIIMVIPAAIVMYFLNIAGQIVAFLSWIVIVVTGKQPQGLQNFQLMVQRYYFRLLAYHLLLTDRYPNFSDPESEPLGGLTPSASV